MLQQSYTREELIEIYGKQVSEPYKRCADSFIKYVQDNKDKKADIVNEWAERFALGKSRQYKSMAKRFVRFYDAMGRPTILPESNVSIYNAHNDVIQAYMQYCDRSESTKVSYLTGLNKYAKYCSKKQIPFLHYLSAKQFKESLLAEGLSASSVNLNLAAIKSMAKFCLRNRDKIPQFTKENAEQLRDIGLLENLATKNQKIKVVLNRRERAQLLKSIQDPAHRLIIALMCMEGLRRGEIQSINADSFDFERNMLKVRGKGYKNEDAEVKIFAYTRALAINLEPSMLDMTRFYPRNVSKLAMHYIKEAGVWKQGIKAHSLRHTALQILTNDGWPMEFVRLQARHAHISTTEIYTSQATLKNFQNYDYKPH